jgi:uncharacterized membrane protein (UPF0127 family)
MGEFNKYKVIPLFENFCKKQQVDGKTITANLCDRELNLKVASTPRSQAQGFMSVDASPSENEGMLFIYDEPMPLSFWMKNVKFPLDIIFFDSNLKYVGHETMLQHNGEEDHELPRYSSKKPARFAVEVCSGWCDKYLTENPTLSF